MSDDKYHGGEINIHTSLKIEGPIGYVFMDEPCEEIVRINPNGEVFFRGKLVETDEQRIQAFNALVGVLAKSMTRPE